MHCTDIFTFLSMLFLKNFFSNLLVAQETGVQSQDKSYQIVKKCYSIPPYLTLGTIRYVSRTKLSNPGKGVAPSSKLWCSSYWKRSLWVALDYVRQLYLSIYLSIYLSVIHNKRRTFEAASISLCNSLNTRPGFYNISPYLSKSILN